LHFLNESIICGTEGRASEMTVNPPGYRNDFQTNQDFRDYLRMRAANFYADSETPARKHNIMSFYNILGDKKTIKMYICIVPCACAWGRTPPLVFLALCTSLKSDHE
jgi:hypothetical protein